MVLPKVHKLTLRLTCLQLTPSWMRMKSGAQETFMKAPTRSLMASLFLLPSVLMGVPPIGKASWHPAGRRSPRHVNLRISVQAVKISVQAMIKKKTECQQNLCHRSLLLPFIYLLFFGWYYVFVAARGLSLVVLSGGLLSSCVTQVWLPQGMWNLPGPGLEPVSPVLAGGFPTTGPPGKSSAALL